MSRHSLRNKSIPKRYRRSVSFKLEKASDSVIDKVFGKSSRELLDESLSAEEVEELIERANSPPTPRRLLDDGEGTKLKEKEGLLQSPFTNAKSGPTPPTSPRKVSPRTSLTHLPDTPQKEASVVRDKPPTPQAKRRSLLRESLKKKLATKPKPVPASPSRPPKPTKPPVPPSDVAKPKAQPPPAKEPVKPTPKPLPKVARPAPPTKAAQKKPNPPKSNVHLPVRPGYLPKNTTAPTTSAKPPTQPRPAQKAAARKPGPKQQRPPAASDFRHVAFYPEYLSKPDGTAQTKKNVKQPVPPKSA